jgi:hypothetical protein
MWRCAANINSPTTIMSPANAIVPKTVHPQDGTIAALSRDSRYRFHRIYPGYKYQAETLQVTWLSQTLVSPHLWQLGATLLNP